MDIKVVSKPILDVKSDLIILNIFEGEELSDSALSVDKALGGLISEYVIKKEKFKGSFGKFYELTTYGKIGASKVLLAGAGKISELSSAKLREIMMKTVQKITSIKTVKSAAMELPFEEIATAAQMIAEGAILGGYRFNKYKSKKEENELKTLTITDVEAGEIKEAQKGAEKGSVFALASNFARDLINEPAQEVTPDKLVEVAKSVENVETKILNKKECEKLGMKAFLAVGQGSVHEPKLIHIKYSPKNPKKKIAIIGKGITFDSGGLDLKPAPSMLNMKDDMSGSAAVLSVIKTLSQIGAEVEVHAIVAACENMPGSRAYKPGDILTAKNGKTIEIDNTDAEGRLTLADALCYAQDLGVDEIIDIATLTGACMVALGHYASGIMGNNQKFIEKLVEASELSGEVLWQLPLFDEHGEAIKSDIADMKNTGARGGGASTAGAFLKNFVPDKIKWAHIDIAGTAYLDKPYKGFIKGATGMGARTILEYVLSH